MSYFSAALGWTTESSEVAHGEWVTYTRGTASVEVKAVRGQSEQEYVSANQETVVGVSSKDWLIRVDGLYVDGVAIEPAHGDEIEDSNGVTYRVTGPGGARPWTYTDQHRTRYRIHTQISDDGS